MPTNSTLTVATVSMTTGGAYATGNYIGVSGTPGSFLNAVRWTGGTAGTGGTGIIKSIRITDKKTAAAAAMELWVFGSTFVPPADKAAWTITATEALTCLGVIPIITTKWYASGANKVYMDDTLAITIKLSTTTLYYALVARGTTPTWASGDLVIGLGILED